MSPDQTPTTVSTTATSEPAPAKPVGIHWYDRTFVAGQTGGGKSTLINVIAASYRCQVLLLDSKDEFTVPGVDPVHRPENIDWRQRVIHLIDDRGDVADVDRLFRIAWARKAGRSQHQGRYGLVIVVHELADLCEDQPGKTPRWFSNDVRKGRAHGIGLLYGAQRPRNIPRISRTEIQHVISMARGCDPEDAPIMAGLHRLTVPQYEQALEQARRLGEHAYLWTDRTARATVIRPPLPPEMLQRTLASGIGPEHSGMTSTPERTPELTPEHSGTFRSSHHSPEFAES